MTALTSAPVSVGERWDRARNLFLDRLWLSLFLYACVAVPLSMARAFVTGWQPVYAVHFLFLAVIGTTYIVRARLSYDLRVLLFIGILDATALAGVLTFGLMASSWWWLFLASLILALAYRMRAGVIHAVFAMFVLMLMALGYVQGYLVLDFDAGSYLTSMAAWVTLMVGPGILTISLFLSVATFQEEMQALLSEADALRHFSPTCVPCKKEWDRTLDEAAEISAALRSKP